MVRRLGAVLAERANPAAAIAPASRATDFATRAGQFLERHDDVRDVLVAAAVVEAQGSVLLLGLYGDDLRHRLAERAVAAVVRLQGREVLGVDVARHRVHRSE